MASTASNSPSRNQSGQLKNRANQFFIWYTGAILQVYKNIFAGPIGKVVPEHTREAFFQAYCDLRTNVPKDRKFVDRHAAALQPRTLLGWLAMGAFLAFSGAAGCAILCLSFATIATLGYAIIGIVIVAGATAGFWLFVLSGVLFVSSVVIAWVATCATTGYIFLASAAAVLSYLQSRFLTKTNTSTGNGTGTASITATTLPPLSSGSKVAESVPQLSSSVTAAPDLSPGRMQNSLEPTPTSAESGISLADVVANISNGPTQHKKAAAVVHPDILKI